MANITVRDLPDQTKESLQVDAAKAGISLEAYASLILQKAASYNGSEPINILELVNNCFDPNNGIDLELPNRNSHREAVDLQ